MWDAVAAGAGAACACLVPYRQPGPAPRRGGCVGGGVCVWRRRAAGRVTRCCVLLTCFHRTTRCCLPPVPCVRAGGHVGAGQGGRRPDVLLAAAALKGEPPRGGTLREGVATCI